MANTKQEIQQGISALIEDQPIKEVGRRILRLLEGLRSLYDERQRALAAAVLSGNAQYVRNAWEQFDAIDREFVPAFQEHPRIKAVLGEGMLAKLNELLSEHDKKDD
jgi:hypothetical protein